MATDTKPTCQRNPEHQSTSSSPAILEENVEVEETNQQPREMSIEEAAARVTKERAALAEKLKKVDIELLQCEREIRKSYQNAGASRSTFYWNRIKSTLSKRKHMYNRYINSLDGYSNMLDETSLSLEEAEIKSTVESLQTIVESAQRNLKRKVG